VTTIEEGNEDKAGSADHHDAEAEHHDEDGVEQLGGDALEDVPHRVSRPRRNYKIQEVIKRRQVLLVQVVKEERGNKGAALTTYLSLAGRYSVLMPNTARGGGISRKITDAEDRKRLKAIAQELDVPDGMGIILRTAGAARGMPEVKRDFEYLMRMWETVRETTLRSSAPTLVYEEGSLIKRSIRDLFNKDVDEVMVSGEEAYREAKDFMRLLMPTHAKSVVRYSDPQPIFAKAGAEAQLDAMFSNQVTLKSGGYLVINQTEALVAIDVNSGRSTREHNIEDTALRTNLEAADEVARQLRLRDLAGLIVVDFIDMDEGRNDRAVERRIKDALKNDRARIQIGRISHFGLLEMSRQRMRTGVLEGSTVMCPHCAGSGTVRSMSSIALHVLRLIEDSLIKSAAYNLIVRTRSEVALYILNQKRMNLLDLESRFGVAITILADAHMTGAVYHAIERGSEATPPVIFGNVLGARADALAEAEEEDVEGEDDVIEGDAEPQDGQPAPPGQGEPSERGQPRAGAPLEEGEGGRRRRRRRRRRGRDGQNGFAGRDENAAQADEGDHGSEDAGDGELDHEDLSDIAVGFAPPDAEAIAEAGAMPEVGTDVEAAPLAEAAPPASEAPMPDPIAVMAEEKAVVETAAEAAEPAEPATEAEATEAPRRRRARRTTRSADAEAAVETVEVVEPALPARRARRPRARPDAPSLDLALPGIEVEATAGKPVPSSEPELPLAAAAPAAPAPVVAVEPALAEAEPAAAPSAVDPMSVESASVEPESDRPKRSGWWQRAKATFTSGE
jgi:ribonuclease E